MVKCSAVKWGNSHEKGFVLVRFPKDENLLEAWRLAAKLPMANYQNRLCEVRPLILPWRNILHSCQFLHDITVLI